MIAKLATDLLLNSPKCLPWFSSGYEGKENMFYFLNEKSFKLDWLIDWLIDCHTASDRLGLAQLFLV